MRFVFGIIGIIAALAFVSYAAVTSYHTAASMTTQFAELAGWAAAGMVCWEALGALYVQQCWRNGSKLMAIGGAALVLAATVYLVRLDLRFHVAGQSDVVASRESVAQGRDMARSEYQKAIARRDELQKAAAPSRFQRDELTKAERRIAELEPRLWSPDVVSSGMPEAGWASRMLGNVSTDRQWWTDALMVLGLLFWALARMMALPVAVTSMQIASKRRQEAPAAPKAEAAPSVAEKASSPVSDAHLAYARSIPDLPPPGWASAHPWKSPDDDPTPPSGGKPDPLKERTDLTRKAEAPAAAEPVQPIPSVRLAVNNDVFEETDRQRNQTRTKKKEVKRAEGSVVRWLDASTTQTPDKRVKATSRECRRSYLAFCEIEGSHPVGHKQQSRMMAAALRKGDHGRRGPRNGDGAVWPGLIVVQPSAEPLRRRA
jgi:hypothetical protein